jgi:hypothetical protein
MYFSGLNQRFIVRNWQKCQGSVRGTRIEPRSGCLRARPQHHRNGVFKAVVQTRRWRHPTWSPLFPASTRERFESSQTIG